MTSPLNRLYVTNFQGHEYLTEKNIDDCEMAETKTATDNLQKLINEPRNENKQDNNSSSQSDIQASQVDFMNTSLKLEMNMNNPRKTNGLSNEVNRIDQIMKKRHHIATLRYTMTNGPKRIPKFLHTNIEFYPFYGSAEAKNFFTNKIRNIRATYQQQITEQLTDACDEFIKQCTDEAEEIKQKIRGEMDPTTEEGRQIISDVQSQLQEVTKKWNEEFEKDVTTMDKNVIEKKDSNNDNYKRNNRFGPYKRFNRK